MREKGQVRNQSRWEWMNRTREERKERGEREGERERKRGKSDGGVLR